MAKKRMGRRKARGKESGEAQRMEESRDKREPGGGLSMGLQRPGQEDQATSPAGALQ